jgi:hypothetical protein
MDRFFLSRAEGVETKVGVEGGCEMCHGLSWFSSIGVVDSHEQ